MKPLVVNPYRFSADPIAMLTFLEALGLVPVVSSASGYTLLQAQSGYVAVHPPDDSPTGPIAGETHLVLLTDDATAAADHLRAAGLPTTTWDESYGRHAGVVDPRGDGILINEEQSDLYGYTGHPAASPGPVGVTAVRYSHDFAADLPFYAALGFQVATDGGEWWQGLRAGPESGVIGLHFTEDALPVSAGGSEIGPNPLVNLGFETDEPLAALAARLTAAGHPAEVVTDAAATKVHVTDPDGCLIEIHPRA